MKKHLILCPIDFSKSSGQAIRIAADLAQANNSKIVLLNVTDAGEKPLSMEDMQSKKIADRVRDLELSDRGIEFLHVNLRGNPAEMIVEYAEKYKADMIVMGTHGRTGLAKLMAGSVATSVMARASCPVVTVKLPS